MIPFRLSMLCQRLWPWLVLCFGALNVIFLGGKRRAFGVFVAELHVDFNETVSLAELNWIGDSYAALGYITTTASTALILCCERRFRLFMFIGAFFVILSCFLSAQVPNPHWLFLTHTLLHGLGSSLILSVVGLVVNEYFNEQHHYHILATMLVSGGSVASIIFVQMFAVLVENYGWRQALIILGITYFAVELLSVPFFKKNQLVDDYTRQPVCVCHEENIKGCWKRLLVLLWFLDRVITSIVTYGLLMNLVDYVRRCNVNLTKSSGLTMLFAGGEAATYLLGAVVTATTGNLFKNRLRYLLLITTGFMTALLFLWQIFARKVYVSEIVAFFCGFCMGPSITFLFPAGEELTRLPGHFAYPFSLAGMGVGMLVSPLVTALIAERTDYRYFFAIQGGLMAMKTMGLLTASLILHFKRVVLCESYEPIDTCDKETDVIFNGEQSTSEYS